MTRCTDHHPASSEEDDNTEDVDHAGREDPVPGAEEKRRGDKEVALPPWLTVSRLQQTHHKVL